MENDETDLNWLVEESEELDMNELFPEERSGVGDFYSRVMLPRIDAQEIDEASSEDYEDEEPEDSLRFGNQFISGEVESGDDSEEEEDDAEDGFEEPPPLTCLVSDDNLEYLFDKDDDGDISKYITEPSVVTKSSTSTGKRKAPPSGSEGVDPFEIQRRLVEGGMFRRDDGNQGGRVRTMEPPTSPPIDASPPSTTSSTSAPPLPKPYQVPPDELKRFIEHTIQHTRCACDAPNVTITGEAYNAEWVKSFKDQLAKCDIFVEKSPKGTGKTTAINDLIYEEIVKNPKVKILAFSSRISYAIFFKNAVNAKLDEETIKNNFYMDKRFSNYLELVEHERDIYLGDEERIISSLDGIGRFFNKGGAAEYDILVLDEFKSLLRYLCSSHIADRRSEMVDGLVYMLRNVKKIIISDADMDQMTLNVLIHLLGDRKRKIHFSYNQFRNDKRKYPIYGHKAQFYDKLVEYAKDNKMFIPTNSFKDSEEIATLLEQKFPEKRTLLINSDVTSTNMKNKVLDTKYWKPGSEVVNGVLYEWHGYDFVVASPSVDVGVSTCNKVEEAYFDIVAGVYGSRSNTPEGANQQTQRCRNPKKQMAIIYLPLTSDKKEEDFSISVEELESGLSRRFDEVITLVKSNQYDITTMLHESTSGSSNSGFEDFSSQSQSDDSNSGWSTGSDGERRPSRAKSGWSQYMHTKNKNDFLNSNYVAIWKAFILEKRMGTQNFRAEFLKIVRNHIVDESQIVIVPGPDTDYERRVDMKEHREVLKDATSHAIANAYDIPNQDQEKIVAKKHIKTKEDILALRKFSIRAFYRVNELTEEFVSVWYKRMSEVARFHNWFLRTDNTIVTIDKTMMVDNYSEELVHLTFVKDQKHCFLALLKAYGIVDNKFWNYKYDHRTVVVDHVNQILKRVVFKDGTKLFVSRIQNNATSKTALFKDLCSLIGISVREKRVRIPEPGKLAKHCKMIRTWETDLHGVIDMMKLMISNRCRDDAESLLALTNMKTEMERDLGVLFSPQSRDVSHVVRVGDGSYKVLDGDDDDESQPQHEEEEEMEYDFESQQSTTLSLSISIDPMTGIHNSFEMSQDDWNDF